jgi:predicted HAD superfamily phosphohydrolase YqeG
VRASYLRCATLGEALRAARQRAARTVLLDVEPQVAHWRTGPDAYDQGLARVLDRLTGIPGARVVCFTTNSARRPSVPLNRPGLRVVYVAWAAKPFRLAPYRDFPGPGVVIGDQVLTDGLLARRLGYTFIHCPPEPGTAPAGPRLLGRCGLLLRPLLFRRRG